MTFDMPDAIGRTIKDVAEDAVKVLTEKGYEGSVSMILNKNGAVTIYLPEDKLCWHRAKSGSEYREEHLNV